MDLVRGVAEIALKTVVWVGQGVLHLATQHIQHVTPSEHFRASRELTAPNPIHLNKWEDEAYDAFYDGDDPQAA